jgi:predicted DNA-binding protein (UPF0251 family)
MEFEALRKKWECGEVSAREAGRQLGISYNTFLRRMGRQGEGRAAAKARGLKFGKKLRAKPPGFESVYEQWKRGEIPATEASKRLGLKSTTPFYRWVSETGTDVTGGTSVKMQALKESAQFKSILEAWKLKKVSANEASKRLGIGRTTFLRWAREDAGTPKIDKRTLTKKHSITGTPLFKSLCEDWQNEKISAAEASKRLGIGRTTFFEWAARK